MASSSGGLPPEKGKGGDPQPTATNSTSTSTSNSNGVSQNSDKAPANQSKYSAITKKTGESKWLTMQLHREDKNIPFNLTKLERGALLFRKLKIPVENVKSLELCNFEQIRIEITGDINLERYKTVEALQIRPGLKVQPMKEMKLTTRIKVCWVPLDVPDEAIFETLSIFGKIEKDSLRFLTYEVNDEEKKIQELYDLRNVRNGERSLEIKIEQPIPSYVKIAGKRARIWHPGQNFSCGRCYKSFRNCPGKADRSECKRQGGTERDFEDFWAEVSNRQPRKERMGSEEFFTTSTVDIGQVPKDTKKEVLMEWIRTEGRFEIDDDQLHPTTFPSTWRLTNVASPEIMNEIVKRLHGKTFGKRPLLFLPIRLPTPVKPKPAEASAAAQPPGSAEPTVHPAVAAAIPPPAPDRQPLLTDVEKSVEAERKRLSAEFEKKKTEREEQERREMERERRNEEEKGEKSKGSSGKAEEGAEAPAEGGRVEVEEPVSTNIVKSPSLISNLMHMGLEKFGIIKNNQVIKVHNPPMTGLKDAVTSSPAKEAEVPETPAPQSPEKTPTMATRVIVKETPADVENSPHLQSAKSPEVSIPSDDEIFGTDSIVKEPTFASKFARDLSMSERRSISRGRKRSQTQVRKRPDIINIKMGQDKAVKRSTTDAGLPMTSTSSYDDSPEKVDKENFQKSANQLRKERRKMKKMKERAEEEAAITAKKSSTTKTSKTKPPQGGKSTKPQ